MKIKSFVLHLALGFAVLCAVGCEGYYAAYPGYYGPYYGGSGGPYYGGYPGSVTIAVGDRPYYRGAGYWARGTYYVWRPGHWRWRNGARIWVPGHYVVRGY